MLLTNNLKIKPKIVTCFVIKIGLNSLEILKKYVFHRKNMYYIVI